jgi:putative Ca2+/H+ antiporter (TMEM165/GDT1 family)
MLDSLTNDPFALASSFSLVGLAEIGDKSQLVCMTLAARYRAWPVFLGALGAFSLLNLLAVVFGAAVAHWLPEQATALIVSALFIAFGLHALRNAEQQEDDEQTPGKASHSVFFSTFLLISLAEFGDKTQLAVAGLSSTADPLLVWIGATAALAATSGLGVWAGCTVMQRIPISLLHRISGGLFIALGLAALASVAW